MANMAMVKMFGCDFGPARLGVNYHRFNRSYNLTAAAALPRTYGPDAGSMEMRFMAEPHIRTLEIGLPGIEFLKGAMVAEITVLETIEQEYARRAVSMLSSNYEVLMDARRSRYGIGGFLSTDHMECAGFSGNASSFFSDRVVGGLRGILIGQYQHVPNPEQTLRLMRTINPQAKLKDYHTALNLGDSRVIDLFARLGLKVPQDVHPSLAVAQFDIVSIFADGAVYADMIHIPFEFLEAEPL